MQGYLSILLSSRYKWSTQFQFSSQWLLSGSTGGYKSSVEFRRRFMTEQNFSNHVKYAPAFHFFAAPVLITNFGWSIHRLIHDGLSVDGVIAVLTAAAMVVTLFLARIFALKVQDRVIRLEERLRMQQLLPDDLKPRIPEFTSGQLVALRFASDAELPALARKVLAEKIVTGKTIKQMIQVWRPDHLRA
jgi:hypothetical protein